MSGTYLLLGPAPAPTPYPQVLEAPLEKKAGINYGPPGNRSLVYFVDDLNMPRLDAYETAMPISLIRQHLAWGHWFDRAKLTQKNINGCARRSRGWGKWRVQCWWTLCQRNDRGRTAQSVHA